MLSHNLSVCLSFRLSATNFDPNYLRIGKTVHLYLISDKRVLWILWSEPETDINGNSTTWRSRIYQAILISRGDNVSNLIWTSSNLVMVQKKKRWMEWQMDGWMGKSETWLQGLFHSVLNMTDSFSIVLEDCLFDRFSIFGFTFIITLQKWMNTKNFSGKLT